MAKKSGKALWVIGSFVVIGGAIAYFIWRSRKDKSTEMGDAPPPTGEPSAYVPSSSGSSSSSSSSTSNPFKTSDELKAFQNWVINVKKDASILGSAGADGKWGSNSRKAWEKYGKEYTPSGAKKRVTAKIAGTPIYRFTPSTNEYSTTPKDTTKNMGQVLGNHYGREINVTIPSVVGNKVFKGIVFYASDESANIIDKNAVILA